MPDSNGNCYLFHAQYAKHQKENDAFVTNSGEQGATMDTLISQQTNTITMGDLNSITGNIIYDNKSNQPVIGMAFISRFDWIIDMYRGKVYANLQSGDDR